MDLQNNKFTKWANSLEGWHWWAYQIIAGIVFFAFVELIVTQFGYSVLPWKWI